MKSSELLDTCADRWEAGFGWAQRCLARNAANEPAPATSKDAVACCSIGMLLRCAKEFDGIGIASTYLTNYLLIDPVYAISVWNDATSRTKEEIIHAFRGAAELARSAKD